MRLQVSAQWKPRGDLGRYVEAHVTPGLVSGIGRWVKWIEVREKELAAVDTGAMRDSITSEVDDTGKTVIGRVGPNVPYAPYVEFGTGIAGAASAGAGAGPYSSSWPGMPAQPFVRPAMDESRNVGMDFVRKDVSLALR